MFVDVGFSCIRNWLIGGSPALKPTYIAMGSSATEPAFSNSGLGLEWPITRQTFDAVDATESKHAVFEHFLGSDTLIGSDIWEIGLFDGSPTGNMYARQVTGLISKGSNMTIQSMYDIFIDGSPSPF